MHRDREDEVIEREDEIEDTKRGTDDKEDELDVLMRKGGEGTA